MIKQLTIYLCLSLFYFDLIAQNNSIVIQASVWANDKIDFQRIMVVNKTTHTGFIAQQSSDLMINCQKNDTIMISVIGYEIAKLCYADSALKKKFKAEIKLRPILKNLPEITIVNKRTLDEIYQDISKLGYSKQEYLTSGIDAVSSPITFLYERFSRRAQAKRLAIELEKQEQTRDLLKELFVKFIDAQIIDLDRSEFEQFVDHCRISEFELMSLTQYEFIVLIKQKFKTFKRYGY